MRRHYYKDRFNRDHEVSHRKNRIIFGVLLAIVGVLLMLKTMGIFFFSYYHSWPFILIFIGLFIGIKTGFRRVSSWALIAIGAANLFPVFFIMGHPSYDFAVPAFLILGGLAIILRPRRPYCGTGLDNTSIVTNPEDSLNIDVTFGGRKEMVTSKNFKGGIVSTTFGGTEINLMQADTTEKTMVLDFRVSFGGIELIVPSHWQIQNEVNPSFGSVEDERMIQINAGAEDKKILILRGTVSFGSIEIKSYH